MANLKSYLATSLLLVFFVGVYWLFVYERILAAPPDPSKNYLYGSSYSDCLPGDYRTTQDTANSNGIHCVRLSNDSTTNSFSVPVNNTCPRGPFGPEGGIMYDSGAFGVLCVYFKPGTVVIESGVIDIGSPTRFVLQADCKEENLDSSNCEIVKYILLFTNVLSGIVGVVVIAMVIAGGIQYSSAGGDPSRVAAAKKRISNALLALLAYIFLFAFLQWVVPGGIF